MFGVPLYSGLSNPRRTGILLSLLDPELTKIHCNIGNCSPNDTASHPGQLAFSTWASLSEPVIGNI